MIADEKMTEWRNIWQEIIETSRLTLIEETQNYKHFDEIEDKLISKASTSDLQLQQNRLNNANATITSHTAKINDLITRDNEVFL